MRIQHANVAPLKPDTLAAIHLIADLMNREEENRGKERGIDAIKESFAELQFLESLLWGCCSFGTAVRSYDEQYASLGHPPLRDVLTIFHEQGLADVHWIIDIGPESIERYEKSPAMEHIVTDRGWMSDKEAVKVWQTVKERVNDVLHISLPLKDCYSFCLAILIARQIEFEEALRDVQVPGSDHAKMLQLYEEKPIRFSLEEEHYKHIADVLWKIEGEYLEAFMDDRIRWHTNTPKWEWQLAKVLPVLQERSKQFTRFWVSTTDAEFLASQPQGNSYKLVETLLALSLKQTIDILEIAPASGFILGERYAQTDVRFRVQLNEEEESEEKKKTATVSNDPKPILVLTRNDRTGELLMNGKHLITPQSGGTGDRLMEELFNRNKDLRVVKLTDKDIRTIKDDKKYPISNVLTNLGFKGDLREAFFPTSSNNAVIFVNPVYEADLRQHGISRVPELSRAE